MIGWYAWKGVLRFRLIRHCWWHDCAFVEFFFQSQLTLLVVFLLIFPSFVLKLLLRFLPCPWRQFRQLKRHLFCSFSKLWFSFSDSDMNVVSILWRFQIQMSHCMMQMVLLQRRFDSLVMLLPWWLWKEFVLDACLKVFVFCADVVTFVVALDDEDGIAVMKIWFLRMKLLWWLCKECV